MPTKLISSGCQQTAAEAKYHKHYYVNWIITFYGTPTSTKPWALNTEVSERVNSQFQTRIRKCIPNNRSMQLTLSAVFDDTSTQVSAVFSQNSPNVLFSLHKTHTRPCCTA